MLARNRAVTGVIDMTTIVSNKMASKVAGSSHETDKINMLGLNEREKSRFGKVLQNMDMDNIPNFASSIRQHGHRSVVTKSTQALSEACLVKCRLLLPPVSGSYNIVFPIEFEDGVKWMLKIHANGDHFDPVAATALESEVRTMQMIRKETIIPVPTIYAFDTSSQNALLSPFILMERLDGRPLYHLWFDSQVPKARLGHFRVKVLQNLARAMAQLNKFTLNTGGSLVFDSDGTPVGVGSAKVMDVVALFNKAKAPRSHQQESQKGGHTEHNDSRVEAEMSKTTMASAFSQVAASKGEDEDIICERGPFCCPKAYFLSNLDRSDPAFRADAYERGTDISLRLFIEWAFVDIQNHDRRFVLAHPDLDIQNILIAEDGTLTGVIDWDGVAAVPREVGCTQYPLWLMRDWAPLWYEFDTQRGVTREDAGYEESSPAELASYRALYVKLLEVEIEKMTGGPNKTTNLGTLPKQEAEITRRSLIMRSLDLSAADPWAALTTVNLIIDQIKKVTASEWEVDQSDMNCISPCLSVSDADDAVDTETGKEDTESKYPKSTREDINLDHRTDQVHQKTGCLESLLPEVAMNAEHSSFGIAEQHQVSSLSCDACQTDFEKVNKQTSSKSDAGDGSTSSALLGWTRRLVRYGCNTVARSLSEIARMVSDLETTVDEAPELSTEAEIRRANISARGRSLRAVGSDPLQPRDMPEPPEDFRTKKSNSRSSNKDTVDSEQLKDDKLITSASTLKGAPSSRFGGESKQIKKGPSIPPTVEARDIPLRKAELLQAARVQKIAERKALYRADKAKIEEELKVWERIALAVWGRGVSLEQLQLNEGEIARWVADRFNADKEQGSNPDRSPHRPAADGAVSAVTDDSDRSAAVLRPLEDHAVWSEEEPEKFLPEEDILQATKVKCDESLRTSEVIVSGSGETIDPESNIAHPSMEGSISNNRNRSGSNDSTFDIFQDNDDESDFPITTSHKMPGAWLSWSSGEDEVPGRFLSEQKNDIFKEETAKNIIEVVEVRSHSRPPSTPGHYILPAKDKTFRGLKGLCKSGFSHMTQMFFNRNRAQDKWSSSIKSSVPSVSDEDEGGSEKGDARSSATSLSDSQAGNAEVEKISENKFSPLEADLVTAHKGSQEGGVGDEILENSDKLDREEGRMKEATELTDRFNHAPLTETSLEEDKPIQTCAARKVHDPSDRDCAESDNSNELTNSDSLSVASDKAQVNDTLNPENNESKNDTRTEDSHEDRTSQGKGNKATSDSGASEFKDYGGFDRYLVCNLLGMGQLDELRLLRLKEGFLKLLEEY